MGWLLVMFDLPTDTAEERRKASRFRNDLLDRGYLMLQYSVYARCAVTLEKKETLVGQLKAMSPDCGNIHCLFVTDAQWGDATVIYATPRDSRRIVDKDSTIGEQLQFW